MRELPIREVSKTEYEETNRRIKRENCGSEAGIIFNFRPNVARKRFLNTFQLEKKLPKLEWLYQNEKELENDVKILEALTYRGKFFSYDMTYDENDISLFCAPLSIEEKLPYFHMTRKKLDNLHQLNIVFGDVKADNILVNLKTGSCSLCDLDNIQIGDKYPMDTVSDYLEFFTDENGFVGEDADIYMHNLMILTEFALDGKSRNKKEYWRIQEMLADHYQFDFLKASAAPTLEKMNDAFLDYKGDYLIDYVKIKRR